MPTLVAGPLGGPKLAEGLEVLICRCTTLLERGAEQLELLLHPAGADAEYQATVGQDIERRQRLCRLNDRPMRHDHHGRKEL